GIIAIFIIIIVVIIIIINIIIIIIIINAIFFLIHNDICYFGRVIQRSIGPPFLGVGFIFRRFYLFRSKV
ncbi:hypothetical protein ACDT12_13575, partial [Staphylococcus aureus]